MANYDTDEIGKPGKPPRKRAFPWRLWLFAIAMTAAAGAGGYYYWTHRGQTETWDIKAKSHELQIKVCSEALAKQRPALDEASKKTTLCQIDLGDAAKQVKDLQAKLGLPPSPPAPATAAATPSSVPTVAAVVAPPTVVPAAVPAGRWQAPIEDIQKQLARMGETAQLRMSARRGTFVMTLPAEALFAAGVAELTKAGELAVLEVGFTLKRYPDRRFLVTGHTDEVPVKGAPYKDSWELSLVRGLTVTRVLIQAGVDPKSLLAAGAGDADPLAKGDAKNRRIEIALLPSASELPALPASLGADTFKPELKVEAPLPPVKPDAKPAR
jgi:flagellar motor protein MotB